MCRHRHRPNQKSGHGRGSGTSAGSHTRRTATSSQVSIRPANDAGPIAAIKTAVPSFAESSATFGAISLCLCTAPEHVGADPAVCPLALVYEVLITWRRLTVVDCSGLGFRTIAHSARPSCPFIGSCFASCRAIVQGSAATLPRQSIAVTNLPYSLDKSGRVSTSSMSAAASLWVAWSVT
jgi:hypothetical protein